MNDKALTHLESSDPVLRDIMEAVPYPDYANTNNVFEDLASCILDMRIHYAGSPAAFRYKRLKILLSGKPVEPELFLDMPIEFAAQLKLSRQKDESLKLWSKKWLEEDLQTLDWQGLTDEQIEAKLASVKGVSRWTIQMILLFTLEREDIFPVSDYQLKKAMIEAYGLAEDDQLSVNMETLAMQWAPYRSLAIRYLWRWRYPGT